MKRKSLVLRFPKESGKYKLILSEFLHWKYVVLTAANNHMNKVKLYNLWFDFTVRKKRRSGVMHCDYLKVWFLLWRSIRIKGECNILRNFRISPTCSDIYPITFSRHESKEYNSDPALRSPIQILRWSTTNKMRNWNFFDFARFATIFSLFAYILDMINFNHSSLDWW